MIFIIIVVTNWYCVQMQLELNTTNDHFDENFNDDDNHDEGIVEDCQHENTLMLLISKLPEQLCDEHDDHRI